MKTLTENKTISSWFMSYRNSIVASRRTNLPEPRRISNGILGRAEKRLDNGTELWLQAIDSNRAKKLRESRKDVHFEAIHPKRGYKPGEEELETFRSKMYAPNAYDALAPLWHLRKHMGGAKHNLRTWKDLPFFWPRTKQQNGYSTSCAATHQHIDGPRIHLEGFITQRW